MLQYDMFLKKVPKPYTYTHYFKWHEHEFTSTLLFRPQDVHTKIELFTSLSHKNKRGFQIWTQYVENKWEGNRVPLGERKLYCTLTKEPQNYISHFVQNSTTQSK